MNNDEIKAIKYLRTANYSYSFIAKELGLSANTIKAYCVRNAIVPTEPYKTKKEKAATRLCKNCHKPIPPGSRSDTIFCSSACRTKWSRKRRRLLDTELTTPDDSG